MSWQRSFSKYLRKEMHLYTDRRLRNQVKEVLKQARKDLRENCLVTLAT